MSFHHFFTFETMRQRFNMNEKIKIKIITTAKKTSISAAARMHKVDRKCIREWLKQEDSINETDQDKCRIAGAGRPLQCDAFDELLLEEIQNERSQHHRVTRNRVIELGASLLQDLKLEASLSNGWLECFLNRHNLVTRKVTNKPKLNAETLTTRAASFIKQVRELISTYCIQERNIINMDETAIFLEHKKGTTLEERGATDVPVRSFGFEKIRLTAVFAAAADGTKMKPCIMVKGKVTSIQTENGMAKLTNSKSWMNTDSFIMWIDYMFPFVVPNTVLLVFDSARSHISKKSKAHLHARGILFAVIPGGLTCYLQPADYGIFKPLKDRIAESIDEWKRAGNFEYTRGGNVKHPKDQVVIDWIKAAWRTIPSGAIKRSFKSCFLGVNEELCLYDHAEYSADFRARIDPTDQMSPQQEMDMEISDDGEIDDSEIDFE